MIPQLRAPMLSSRPPLLFHSLPLFLPEELRARGKVPALSPALPPPTGRPLCPIWGSLAQLFTGCTPGPQGKGSQASGWRLHGQV